MQGKGWLGGAVVVGILCAVLACGGGFTPGKEVAAATVQDNAPFTMTWSPTTGAPHDLWLDYDLTYAKATWDVLGPVTVRVDGQIVDRFHMTFHSMGSPTTKDGMRYTLTSSESSLNGASQATGTIWLAELPAAAAGSTVEVSGKWNAQPGTTLGALRLSAHE